MIPLPDEHRYPPLLLPGTPCDDCVLAPLRERLPGQPVMVGEMAGASSPPTLAETILREAPPGFSPGGMVAPETTDRAPDRMVALALADTTAAQVRAWLEACRLRPAMP